MAKLFSLFKRKKKRKKKKVTSTKIFMYFIFINCTIIEVYSMAVMYILQDLSALSTLIGAVVGEAVSFAVYAAKSFCETKEEERIKFEREKYFSNNSCTYENEETEDLSEN